MARTLGHPSVQLTHQSRDAGAKPKLDEYYSRLIVTPVAEPFELVLRHLLVRDLEEACVLLIDVSSAPRAGIPGPSQMPPKPGVKLSPDGHPYSRRGFPPD